MLPEGFRADSLLLTVTGERLKRVPDLSALAEDDPRWPALRGLLALDREEESAQAAAEPSGEEEASSESSEEYVE